MAEPRDRLSYEEYVAQPDFLDFEGPAVLACSTWANYALFMINQQGVGICGEDVDRLIRQLTSWREKCQNTEKEHYKGRGDGP